MTRSRKTAPAKAKQIEDPGFGDEGLDAQSQPSEVEKLKAELAALKQQVKNSPSPVEMGEGISAAPVDSGDSEVSFKFPKGTDPKMIKQIMSQMGKVTESQIKEAQGMEAGRRQYIEECKKRYVCIVQSLRPGWDHFEMIVSNPANDKPVPVRGRCGVVLEEGLTKYVIDQLNNTHDYRMEKGRSMTIQQILDVDQAFVTNQKQVKQYHYRVDIIREKENPKPVGAKIGAYAKIG